MQQWIAHELAVKRSEHLFDYCIDHIGCLLLEEALKICRGNRTKAAQLLGVSRPTLHAKIDKYGLSAPHHQV